MTFITLLCMAAFAAEETPMEPSLDTRDARIEAAFNDLSKETVDALDDFYAQNVVFEDPLGRVEGLAALKRYYAKLYEDVTSIAFEFETHVTEGDTHMAVWVMRLRAEGLNGGDEVVVHGTSVLRFNDDDRVVYHRDYFDMGEMVYQHVPIVKFFINRINKRLAHEDNSE